MAAIARNIVSSVYYRLLQIMRQQGWTIDRIGMDLVEITKDTIVPVIDVPANTYGIVNGFPWCFYNLAGDIDPSLTKVYVNGVLQPHSAYIVDYRNGWVSFYTKPTGPVTADFVEYAVNVRDSYPNREWLQAHDLPVVSFRIAFETGDAFAIGTILENRQRTFKVDILANSDPELADLIDDVKRYIIRLDLYNLTEHQPLDYNGDIDTLFDVNAQFISRMRFSKRPQAVYDINRSGDSDKLLHNGSVTFEVENVD